MTELLHEIKAFDNCDRLGNGLEDINVSDDDLLIGLAKSCNWDQRNVIRDLGVGSRSGEEQSVLRDVVVFPVEGENDVNGFEDGCVRGEEQRLVVGLWRDVVVVDSDKESSRILKQNEARHSGRMATLQFVRTGVGVQFEKRDDGGSGRSCSELHPEIEEVHVTAGQLQSVQKLLDDLTGSGGCGHSDGFVVGALLHTSSVHFQNSLEKINCEETGWCGTHNFWGIR